MSARTWSGGYQILDSCEVVCWSIGITEFVRGVSVARTGDMANAQHEIL